MTSVQVRGDDGHTQTWDLRVDEGAERAAVELSSPEGDTWAAEADSLWAAVRDLRVRLDADGILLGLTASRPDVQPSRMSLQMGGGRMAYAVRLGHPAGRHDVVDILTPAELDAVSTVAEQEAFRTEWLASLS